LNSFVPGCVAASQKAIQRFCRSAQSPEETLEPFSRGNGWKREVQQKASRRSSHRRYIAGSARQAFPANAIGRVLFAQEMGTFQEPVARKDSHKPGFRLPQSGIVADSKAKLAASARHKMPSNPPHQGVFIVDFVHNASAILAQPVLWDRGQFYRHCTKKRKYRVDPTVYRN
jgi:hypothetical protein